LVFDLDNTIYEYEPCRISGEKALFKLIESYSGIKTSTSKKIYSSARWNVQRRVQGASSHERVLYIIEFLRLANLKNDPKFVIEALNHYWLAFFSEMKLIPGFKSFIAEIRLRRIPVALVTNLTSEIQYRKLLFLNIHEDFDIVITSQETNKEKDHGEPFKLLIASLKIKTKYDTVWFFGDSDGDFPLKFPTKNSIYFVSPFASEKIQKENIKFSNYFFAKEMLGKSKAKSIK
jgi:FMN phosphatase YigB (HAD superfamily)